MPAPEAWRWTATKTLLLKNRVLLLEGGVEPAHSFDLRRGKSAADLPPIPLSDALGVVRSLGGGGDSVSWGAGYIPGSGSGGCGKEWEMGVRMEDIVLCGHCRWVGCHGAQCAAIPLGHVPTKGYK